VGLEAAIGQGVGRSARVGATWPGTNVEAEGHPVTGKA
jgi:hypothetical protein